MSRNIVRSVRRLSELQRYKPPKWAASVKDIPQHFVRVRKLDFLLADALYKNCDTIFTCGGLQSNHCRATAVASRQLGLSCFLFLRSPKQTTDIGCTGNLLLCKIVGSKMIIIPQLPYKHGLKQMMEKMAKEELNQKGSSVYQIEVGGSSYTGMFGYLTAFQELIEQNVLENFDDIVVTAGTGGTAAGIAIGNYLTGSKLKKPEEVILHVGTNNLKSSEPRDIAEGIINLGLKIQNHSPDCKITISSLISRSDQTLNGKIKDVNKIVNQLAKQHAWRTIPHSNIKNEHLNASGLHLNVQESILEISRTTGVMMDPVYNIKAVRGMLTEMKCNPTRFRGQRILYIHTGGVFDFYDGRIDTLLASSSSAAENAQQVASWGDIDDPMPFFDY
ncbi:uncharacterized protein LOC141891953 isoform X3 [Acropora palmata]|uniref:uncharacterized protein LOC141891953 isoform X3 n=1 Tax=Acropora palmata TaxID=6131 RepID=UPI003DA00033